MKSVMYHIIPSAGLLGSSIKVQALTSGLRRSLIYNEDFEKKEKKKNCPIMNSIKLKMLFMTLS